MPERGRRFRVRGLPREAGSVLLAGRPLFSYWRLRIVFLYADKSVLLPDSI